MNIDEQRNAAAQFAERWSGHGYEKGDTQKFWLELLQKVLFVDDPYTFVEFEDRVMDVTSSFMDVYIPSTHVLIEQKGVNRNLGAFIRQSDGTMLTPFQQAKRYSADLPYSRRPRWVVTCNFAEFWIYDMEQPNGEPQKVMLKDLKKEFYRLQFLVDANRARIDKEMRVSMQAGEIIGRIYDALLAQYVVSDGSEQNADAMPNPEASPTVLRWLNILCVRLVFCLYAEDAGIFAHDQFHDYLVNTPPDDIRKALLDLFETLNTPAEKRSPYLKSSLVAFPYTNGGLFDEKIEIPQFTSELKDTLLQHASLDFDWSEISPTIFGALFESTLNPETRRSGGMHYTSIENIHKVIDPLFLDDLRKEFGTILDTYRSSPPQRRRAALEAFQDRIASLTFLDPACGSGNFLTETYLSLRRLENKIIKVLQQGQGVMGDIVSPVKVSIQQFHGIEINDFAVTVATTALWISESQMLCETEQIVQHNIDYLPLKSYSNIREGNALQMAWDIIEVPHDEIPTIHVGKTYYIPEESSLNVGEKEEIYYSEAKLVTSELTTKLPPDKEIVTITYDYIMGNPPFVGYSLQSKEQKEDLLDIYVNEEYKPYKGAGKIDYVAGWYMKAAWILRTNPDTRAAFVSTNSITQGEQVSTIWRPLFERLGIKIDFAYRTFCWDSESEQKAHVHCVIVGFSSDANHLKSSPVIYDGDKVIKANQINAYLLDAPNVWVDSRIKALCDVPEMQKGSIPVDGGNLIIEAEDYDVFIHREPNAAPYIRRFVGAHEFLHNEPRYCIWLEGVSPHIINSLPLVKQRVTQTRNFRLESNKVATRRYADYPTRFMEIRQPQSNYIIVPSHSSETRRYIPLGFMSPDVIASNANLIIPDATLYHFGILTSSVHMAWMRAVCGRLKSDYRYSKDIVYNNFPWPDVSEAQRQKIEASAQAILDARAIYSDSSLSDLYDERTMPAELRKAHQQNDRAVMQAYGFAPDLSDERCVVELFKLYNQLS